MNSPIYVAPPQLHPNMLPPANSELSDLLRQVIELQKAQIELLRHQIAQADERMKWVNFYKKWNTEYPTLPGQCQQMLPALEKAYLTLLSEVMERVGDSETDPLSNEYAMGEFLDRYGVRLNQLASVLGQVSNMAGLAGQA